MKTVEELRQYVKESNEWLAKVRNARESYDAGLISLDEYVSVMDSCDAFMNNVVKALA